MAAVSLVVSSGSGGGGDEVTDLAGRIDASQIVVYGLHEAAPNAARDASTS